MTYMCGHNRFCSSSMMSMGLTRACTAANNVRTNPGGSRTPADEEDEVEVLSGVSVRIGVVEGIGNSFAS